MTLEPKGIEEIEGEVVEDDDDDVKIQEETIPD